MSETSIHVTARTPASFLWCGGGWKRFQPRWHAGAWWWELGGDWAMGIVDGVTLWGDDVELGIDVDLTAPHAGAVSVGWVVDVQTRRLGPDGLGFEHGVELAVGVDRRAVQVSGRCVGEPRRVVLPAGASTDAPGRLRWVFVEGAISVLWNDVEVWAGRIDPPAPGLLLIGSGADASIEAKARWGNLHVRVGGAPV